MNPRKLLVAGALGSLSLPAVAAPTIDPCRVTGNVVMSGKAEMCRLSEELSVALGHPEVRQTTPTTCEAEGELVKAGRICRIVSPDGTKLDVPMPAEPTEPAPPPPTPDSGT